MCVSELCSLISLTRGWCDALMICSLTHTCNLCFHHIVFFLMFLFRFSLSCFFLFIFHSVCPPSSSSAFHLSTLLPPLLFSVLCSSVCEHRCNDGIRPLGRRLQRCSGSRYPSLSLFHSLQPQCITPTPLTPSSFPVSLRPQSGHRVVHVCRLPSAHIKLTSFRRRLQG